MYCIAGYFLGAYISRIAMKLIFTKTDFVDCSLQSHTHPVCSDQGSVVYPSSDHEDYDMGTASTRLLF
jgi:hypothetical protein